MVDKSRKMGKSLAETRGVLHCLRGTRFSTFPQLAIPQQDAYNANGS
jgi:hypothetical protein